MKATAGKSKKEKTVWKSSLGRGVVTHPIKAAADTCLTLLLLVGIAHYGDVHFNII